MQSYPSCRNVIDWDLIHFAWLISPRAAASELVGVQCLQGRSCEAQKYDPESLPVDKSLARGSCWDDDGRGRGCSDFWFGHYGNFQAKSANDRGEPFVCASNCWCCSAVIRDDA
jgi:hypothetical protein